MKTEVFSEDCLNQGKKTSKCQEYLSFSSEECLAMCTRFAYPYFSLLHN